MYQHAIALTGIPCAQAYEAMKAYVALPAYADLLALLHAACAWSGPPALAGGEWRQLVAGHLRSASSFRADFVGHTPAAHVPQRYGLLCFPAPPSLAEPHARGTHQVWVTCPFGDRADPEIQLVFDPTLLAFASYIKEGKRDLAEICLLHGFAGQDLQQIPATLPDIGDEQAASFAGYELASLCSELGGRTLDVRFTHL